MRVQRARSASKLRGGRRYFAQRRGEVDQIVARLRSAERLELWHHHFDLRSYGERSRRLRIVHRRLLLEAFARARVVASAAGQTAQVFVQLAAPDNCGQDALFCHTSVDGATGFPYRYPGLAWDAPWPAHIREVITDSQLRLGHVKFDGRDFWVLVDRVDPGLSVEPAVAADRAGKLVPPV
jgi:hypothetical protein